MSDHKNELLVQCYISGQIPEDQWQKHLDEDAGLRAYVVESKLETALAYIVPAGLPARARALRQYIRHHPSNSDVREAFEAGWNARKQLDYEIALGIPNADRTLNWRDKL